jgi:response regulator RpfG family c-di-GMP phosphodiesterase
MSERYVGKYEVQTLLAKGSTGAVYRGADARKLVALKLMKPHTVDQAVLARLRQPDTPVARVRHPAIAAFIELIETEKYVCLVSELAEGEPLAARLTDGGGCDLRQTWEVARQVLEALEAAHAKGVCHGNLRPSNVFVDKQGRVTITDLAGCGLVATSDPTYMAPEQLSDTEITSRTDLYQVGALVYRMVSGRPPFSGTPEEIAHRVMQERPSDPSALATKIAWQLDWVIQRALSKDPSVRFGTAREFLEGLRLGLQDSIGAPLPPLGAPSASVAPPAPAAKPAATPTPAAKPAAAPASVSQPASAPAPKAPPAAGPVRPATGAAPTPAGAQLAVTPAKPAPEPSSEGVGKIDPAAATQVKAESGKVRVLFVDDEERVLNGLRALFRQQFEVFTATNGAEALEIVRDSAIQVVVSDQRMPGMTGVELLREARKAAPHTVRMLLTGYSDLAALVGSINEGEIFRFVKKPWDNDEIRAMLAEAAVVAAKLASHGAPRAQVPGRVGKLLVIDAQPALSKVLERLLAGSMPVLLAPSAAEAAKVIQHHDVAAVVGDLDADRDGLVKLFKVLKEKRPEIRSILLAGNPDSEVVAELINQAQVYRFMPKPVNTKELHTHIAEAQRRYATFAQPDEAAAYEAPGSGLAEGVGALLPERLVSRTA